MEPTHEKVEFKKENHIYIFRNGGTQASCFPPKFGGSCFGSVEGCRDCNKVLFKISFLNFIYLI